MGLDEQEEDVNENDLRTPRTRRTADWQMTTSMSGNYEDDPEADPEYQYTMSKAAEEDDEWTDDEGLGPRRTANITDSPSGSSSTTFRTRISDLSQKMTAAAPRDTDLKEAAQRKSRKKGNGGGASDLFNPLSDALEATNKLEERMWRERVEEKREERQLAEQEAKARLELEERRLQLEEQKLESDKAERAEERRMKDRDSEAALLTARTAAFNTYRSAGFSNKQALRMAGLPDVPE